MKTILVINPGSTSTKIAVFKDYEPFLQTNFKHSAEELEPYEHVVDQYDFRKQLILDYLKSNDFDLNTLDGIVVRGGLLGPIHAGAYEVNEDMIWQLKYRPMNEHAANVGPIIGLEIGKSLGIPAYIYDGITVDEITPINKITGLKEFRRKGLGHNLNTRAAAMLYATDKGIPYNELTLIVAHLGGGITVNLHHKGKIIDAIPDEEGPFSPERSGGLPLFDVIKKCYDDGMTLDKMMKIVKRQGGLMSHLGTTECIDVEKMIADGDEHAKLIYDAMALNVAKNIAKCAPDVCGKVDAIVITGGIAYSDYITESIKEKVSFIAPVAVYPGEDEMKALASGCIRVLNGKEQARVYERIENPRG